MNDEVNHRACYGEKSVPLVNSRPSVQDGYFLNKRECKDALKLRYDWSFKDNPTRCTCGDLFKIEHAMIRRQGGFIIKHHK